MVSSETQFVFLLGGDKEIILNQTGQYDFFTKTLNDKYDKV
jgi:hypothetical protein